MFTLKPLIAKLLILRPVEVARDVYIRSYKRRKGAIHVSGDRAQRGRSIQGTWWSIWSRGCQKWQDCWYDGYSSFATQLPVFMHAAKLKLGSKRRLYCQSQTFKAVSMVGKTTLNYPITEPDVQAASWAQTGAKGAGGTQCTCDLLKLWSMTNQNQPTNSPAPPPPHPVSLYVCEKTLPQYAYSPYCSAYISLSVDKENFLTNKNFFSW